MVITILHTWASWDFLGAGRIESSYSDSKSTGSSHISLRTIFINHLQYRGHVNNSDLTSTGAVVHIHISHFLTMRLGVSHMAHGLDIALKVKLKLTM